MESLVRYQAEQTPICFLVNARSGGKKGETLLRAFQKFPRCYMFNIQDLWGTEQGQCTPEILDKLMKVLRMDHVRVVVGGGDGTVSFVCRLLEFLHLEYRYDETIDQEQLRGTVPPIAILPIGVGNELSRCIGWSSGFSPAQSRCTPTDRDSEWEFVRDVRSGHVSSLDFWQVSFEPTFNSDKSNLGKSGQFPMVCFFSIGFDANISHNFHILRETTPYLTSSVAANKWWYTYYGIRELLMPMESVASYLVLSVDGEIVKLPPSIRTLQMFNIHSSADGVDFFGIAKKSTTTELQAYEQPCLQDGLLEVVGTEGVHHLLAIRSGMSHSRRIAQGKEIKVTLTRPLPVQLDGEAWIQPPSTVFITFRRPVSIILGSGTTRGVVHHAQHV